MTEVKIYYVSRKEFSNKLPQSYTNFSELIRNDDSQTIHHEHHVDGQEREVRPDAINKEKMSIENLVIDSDEYSGVNEHVLINFSNLLERYSIETVYLQNPPLKISEQIKKLIGSDELSIEYQNYGVFDKEKILNFYTNFSQKIIGQDRAKKAIAASLIPLLLPDRQKPVVILLYGSSGIGKTESVKLLAESLEEPLLREQFSMYQNNEFANYMFGGKHSEKSFAKELLDRESNLILLDEFDKASPTFYSAFYQLFDEGVFVDKNYSLELRKSVIICTSNFLSLKEIEEKLGSAILGRFDSIIKFQDLDENTKKVIGNQLLENLLSKYEKELNVNISVEKREKIEQAFSSFTNAREIRHFIEETLARICLKDMIE